MRGRGCCSSTSAPLHFRARTVPEASGVDTPFPIGQFWPVAGDDDTLSPSWRRSGNSEVFPHLLYPGVGSLAGILEKFRNNSSH